MVKTRENQLKKCLEVVKWLAVGATTKERACEEVGVNLWEFDDFLDGDWIGEDKKKILKIVTKWEKKLGKSILFNAYFDACEQTIENKSISKTKRKEAEWMHKELLNLSIDVDSMIKEIKEA